jgi:superfamily II DNA or RNA helicase
MVEDEGLSTIFLDGAKSSKKRLAAIDSMKNGEFDIMIASKIFDQGIDIPELDALILAGSGKSSGRALQRIGRVIRKHEGKEKAIVVEFFDNCKYLRSHSEARIKVYKSEPGFNIIMPKNKVLHVYPKRDAVTWV